MDKFTGRRRASWQSKAPFWPFLAGAFAIAVGGGILVSLYASGVLLGDGTSGGRAVVWIKTVSNIVIPALAIGAATGALLNGVYLSPAGRGGALKWSGWLMLAAAAGAAPMSVANSIGADRTGQEIRLREAVTDSRIAARREGMDFYRRMHALAQHPGYGLHILGSPEQLAQARAAVAGRRERLAAARTDHEKAQAEARAALAEAIPDADRRAAVLARFDEAQAARGTLMEKVWATQDRLASLAEEEMSLLYANRGRWRPSPYGGGTVNSPALVNRLDAIRRERREAASEHTRLFAEIASLELETNEAIDEVVAATAAR